MSAFCEKHREEELAVLPQYTKVLVTGNNRTRPVHVGLQGIVKKALGVGGWYWLVLTNGDEVKLQRNALSVIEAPTGQGDDECEDFSFSSLDSASAKNSPRKLTVDLNKLEMVSLWRYCTHFKLALLKFQPSKEQLIEAVERHFLSQQLDEFQVIAGFLQAAKHLKQSLQGLPS